MYIIWFSLQELKLKYVCRALGQGAFGEVYQGFYRHRAGDCVEQPVAVKVEYKDSTEKSKMFPCMLFKINFSNIFIQFLFLFVCYRTK